MPKISSALLLHLGSCQFVPFKRSHLTGTTNHSKVYWNTFCLLSQACRSNNSGQETPMKSSQSESNSSSTPGSPPTVEDSAVYHSSPKPLKSVPAPVPLPESCPAKPCPSPSGGTPLKTKQAAAATTLVSRTPNPQVQASWWKQCWGAERSKVSMCRHGAAWATLQARSVNLGSFVLDGRPSLTLKLS